MAIKALKVLTGLIVAILIGGIAFGFYRTMSQPTQTDTSTMATSPIQKVTIGSTEVTVQVADTDAAREQGLSGRQSLGGGSGMLFVFDTPGKYGFWMKDMNFSIDMLFITASGTIETIAADATPAGYHQNPSQVFYPTTNIQYVLEVPAGFAAQQGIQVGMTATFK